MEIVKVYLNHVNDSKQNELYDESKVKAFVCDITKDEFPDFIHENSVDIVSLLCLSTCCD